MMPARKRCHSARDSPGMTGESEVRPCLRALWRTAALLSGVFGPRLPIGTRLGVTLNERQAPDVTLFEKLFWSFGVWDYGVILELAFFGRVAWRSATVGLPLKLPGRVRVRIDAHLAPHLDREAQQPLGRVEPFRPAVNLNRLFVLLGRREDQLGVEARLRAAPADNDTPGAVAEDVQVRIGQRADHATGHLFAVHAQLRVHAGDNDVQTCQ